mmetsp:Transcript_9300/g.30928  ORF Transcript_9300/g.30928 Transcript_9300/m.30928 type:complete len:339 (-) Transcript_9300:201-1217(-)
MCQSSSSNSGSCLCVFVIVSAEFVVTHPVATAAARATVSSTSGKSRHRFSVRAESTTSTSVVSPSSSIASKTSPNTPRVVFTPQRRPLAAAAAITSTVVVTAREPSATRSTACANSARSSRRVNKRACSCGSCFTFSKSGASASMLVPRSLTESFARTRVVSVRSVGMSHCCHPCCVRIACALLGAPCTNRVSVSSAPNATSASSHFSSKRSNTPAAAACTMPGTPDDAAPCPPSRRRGDDKYSFPPSRSLSEPEREWDAPRIRLAAEPKPETAPETALVARMKRLFPPFLLFKLNCTFPAGTGCPPSINSNNAARTPCVSGYRSKLDATAGNKPGGA